MSDMEYDLEIDNKRRRDIDKETMFNKIMPTHLLNPDADDGEDSLMETVQKVIIKPAEEEPKPGPPPKPKRRRTTKAEAAAAADPPRYINLTELQVLGRLDSMMEKFKCCDCDACRKAIALYALNTLPSKYIYVTVTEAKDILARQDTASITACMVQAIMQVRANPPHPKKS